MDNTSDIKIPKLTPRLSLVASLINNGRRICDIGTDHAFLPVFLTLSRISPSSVAADINKGPLKKAAETILRYNCGDKIKTVLSNGFENIERDDFDDAVIAGMGGELISSILDKAPFLKSKNAKLYLQPMTAIPELRTYLYKNGYTITDERLAKEGEKLYIVFEAVAGKDEMPLEPLFGSCLIKHMGSLEILYLEKLILQKEKIISGLKKAKKETDIQNELSELNTLKEIKERYGNGK